MNTKQKRATVAGAAAVALTLAGALLLTPEPESLAMFYYEGQSVMAQDVPPRMYVLTLKENRSRLDPPDCKPGFWNFPCMVYKTDSAGATVKLHFFRCVDATDLEHVKFDQRSCENQKAYNESFVAVK
jgi:hypothetical protein